MFIELHIIQNFAPSCLNRDDTNAPKDCEFGGYRRARISSQCIKRSIRTYWNVSADKELRGLVGKRTADLVGWLTDEYCKQHPQAPAAVVRAAAMALVKALFVKKGKESKRTGRYVTAYLLFLSNSEMQALLAYFTEHFGKLEKDAAKAAKVQSQAREGAEPDSDDEEDEEKEEKEEKSPLGKAVTALLKAAPFNGGGISADIALFGRMIADYPGLNVDAACQVAHAISTHRVDMDMDFFTAVDDLPPREESGAGMMGIVEFNSSCFYRYALLDTEQLAANLGSDRALARTAALAFVQAAIHAIPTGRQNSMAAQNPPLYVRLIARDGGSPRNLANAFLAPVRPSEAKDLGQASVEKLEKHLADLKRMYGDAGAKLDRTASIYGEGSIDGLVAALKEALA